MTRYMILVLQGLFSGKMMQKFVTMTTKMMHILGLGSSEKMHVDHIRRIMI
jgi:hypothetical protein